MSTARPCHMSPPLPHRGRLRRWSAGIVILTALATLGVVGQLAWSTWWRRSTAVGRDLRSAFPPIVLWAWERPEALEFIDARGIGVAFLARTLYLSGPEVIVRPRLQPLSAPPETKLMAVVRLTADRWRPPDLSVSQREMTAMAI